ncbi:hypothetical protein MTO96_029880 [Rhipicephalus appendiculatus]
MERLRNTRAARRRHSTKIINEVDDLLASNEFDVAGLRSILQRLEKSADELTKVNEALHAEMTDGELLADMDFVLEYEDRAAGSVGLLLHRIEELPVQTSRPSRSNVNIRGLKGLSVSESNYAAMLCEVLMKSIPQEIMVEYHRRRRLEASSANNPPSSEEELQQLLKYLRIEVECRELTNYQRREPYSSDQQTSGSRRKRSIQTSRIAELHPCLADGDGMLRSQTRLRNVVYREGIKHPIVIPGDHIATELIGTALRRRLLHAGVATTIAELQEGFWVTKAKHCVKKVIGQSTWCVRLRVKPATAPMAALPADRVTV